MIAFGVDLLFFSFPGSLERRIGCDDCINMPMGMKPWFYDGIINRFETLFALKRRRLRIEEDFFFKATRYKC